MRIIESICSALGRRPPRLSLPVGLSRVVADMIEKGGHSMGLKPQAIRAMIDKYIEDIAVDGSLIQKETFAQLTILSLREGRGRRSNLIKH